MMKARKIIVGFFIMSLILFLLIAGCGKNSKNTNTEYEDTESSEASNNTESNKNELLKDTNEVESENSSLDSAETEETQVSGVEEDAGQSVTEYKSDSHKSDIEKANSSKTEKEAIKSSEEQKEISSSGDKENPKTEDNSSKKAELINEDSKLCFNDRIYNFSKELDDVDNSELEYKGDVTSYIGSLITPILNGSSNSSIKGAMIYQWSDSVDDSILIEWEETYYLYEYDSDINIEIKEIEYTKEDRKLAWETVFNYLKDIDGVALNDMWYDSDYGAQYRAYYVKYGNGATNGIAEENVMVFEANLIFESDTNEFGNEANTKIIVIKDTESGEWKVDEARLDW